MTEPEPIIRRRTPSERCAYLQGFIAALRTSLEFARDSAEVRAKIATTLRIHEVSLRQAIAERGP